MQKGVGLISFGAGSWTRRRPVTRTGGRRSSTARRLREIQSDKVQAAFAYLYECSPFYRRKFDEAQLTPRDVSSVDDLWKVPVTRKDEWVEDHSATPPWGTFSPLTQEEWTRRGWMFFATSGTTALPRAFRHTRHDRDLWSWIWARALWAQGCGRGTC